MRIGVTVPNVHETLAERTTIDAVGRMADELGFDSIWCNDHLAIPSARDGSGAEPAYAAAYGEQRGQSSPIRRSPLSTCRSAPPGRRRRLGARFLRPLRRPALQGRRAARPRGRGDGAGARGRRAEDHHGPPRGRAAGRGDLSVRPHRRLGTVTRSTERPSASPRLSRPGASGRRVAVEQALGPQVPDQAEAGRPGDGERCAVMVRRGAHQQ
jgi:hypothetical protein